MIPNMPNELKPPSKPENTNSLIESNGESLSSSSPEELIYLKSLRALEHWESEECWCFPTLMYQDPDTGRRVYKHYFPH